MNKKLLAIMGIMFLLFFSGCTSVPESQGCPEDGFVCPDGTVVSRNPDLNCEFDPCPATQADLAGALTDDLDGYGTDLEELEDSDLDGLEQDIDEFLSYL